MIDHDYEVFISYRHRPADALAEKLYRHLQDNYSVNSFRDSEELHFGDFRKQLIRYNKKSRYLLLLLTPAMLDRCNEEGDWIRTEISLFLKKRKPIIPILIDGFTMPDLETLPEDIRGLAQHMDNSFCCSTENLDEAVRKISAHVYKFIRSKWKSQADIDEARRQKDYLSRHLRDNEGCYFYNSALGFRKYLFLFSAELIFLIFSLRAIETGKSLTVLALVFGILSIFLVLFDVKEFDSDLYSHPVSIVDIILDHSIIEVLKNIYHTVLIWIFPFAFFGFSLLLGNLVISSFLSTNDALFEITVYTHVLLPFIRLSVKLIISLLHLLNSLFSHYPSNYLRLTVITKAERILKIIGWSLYGPAIIFCNFLPIILR